MIVKQFEDVSLSHYSYALISEHKMILVDPARDPKPYYQFAEENNADIVAVFETHPHADFVSSHLQIHHETGAIIYTSEKSGAAYPHNPLKGGQKFEIGNMNIEVLFTPGHSPDGLSFYITGEKEHFLFSGDTLFLGDVGRPDLREKDGNLTAKRRELAEMMYETITKKYNHLPDITMVYPTHGAGSLCGKSMSDAKSGTLGGERNSNWAFQSPSKQAFIEEILSGQPFIPSYFGYDVDLNQKGAPRLRSSIYDVPVKFKVEKISSNDLIVDVRDNRLFRQGHLKGSYNIMARSESDKFETWLGAIVRPTETFHLVLDSIADYERLLMRVAKIGYESKILSVVTLNRKILGTANQFNLSHFRSSLNDYTIVDIRNGSEVEQNKIFENAINIPLNELRKREAEIPENRPIVVHCASGYRSAAGASILSRSKSDIEVHDLSDHVKKFID